MENWNFILSLNHCSRSPVMCYASSSFSSFLIYKDYMTQCARTFLVTVCHILVAFLYSQKWPGLDDNDMVTSVVYHWTRQSVLLWLPTRCQQCNPRRTRRGKHFITKVKSEQIIKCTSRATCSLGHSKEGRGRGRREGAGARQVAPNWALIEREGFPSWVGGLQWYLEWAPWRPFYFSLTRWNQYSVKWANSSEWSDIFHFYKLLCKSQSDKGHPGSSLGFNNSAEWLCWSQKLTCLNTNIWKAIWKHLHSELGDTLGLFLDWPTDGTCITCDQVDAAALQKPSSLQRCGSQWHAG